MLSGKNLIIIGGTSGLGLSAAKAFVKQGAKVVVVGKDDPAASEAKQMLGSAALVIVGDATTQDCCVKAIDACVKKFGPVHGLYHVAGGSGRSMGDGPLHELTPDGWNKTLELNLTSLMFSNQAAVKYFREQKSAGAILNMGSVLAWSPSPRHFATHAYAAAKGAIVSFSKALASYYAPENIRVNVIAPGLVETPMSQRARRNAEVMAFIKTKQPLDNGRIGQPTDLDSLAVYFMSDQSKFTTGQVIAVDGGWSVSEGHA
jgi:NAD(P)-dependent dehydrogenase (short-subunit alcohol dehydrogenase family)